MKIFFILSLFFLGLTFTRVNAQKYPEMVSVSGGTFTMGDEFGSGDEDERPTHVVTLNNYKIAKTETTVAQWRAFCAATKRKMPRAPKWGWKDTHPIVNINWDDAVKYCEWLSTKKRTYYRLPTEAEWEYAARGGNKSKGFKYSGGSDLEAVGWYGYPETHGEGTRQVAQKQANELGIYDMSGNVWEWCSDWYGYYDSSSSTNPTGPPKGIVHVLRGGSWGYTDTYSRIASRYANYPFYMVYPYDGFRVVTFE